MATNGVTLTDLQREPLRAQRAIPLLQSLHDWAVARQAEMLPSGKLGEAVAYLLEQRVGKVEQQLTELADHSEPCQRLRQGAGIQGESRPSGGLPSRATEQFQAGRDSLGHYVRPVRRISKQRRCRRYGLIFSRRLPCVLYCRRYEPGAGH